MQCEELEVRIHELLDQRKAIDNDPAIVAHVAVCAECGELVASYRAMLDGVQALPMPQLNPQFNTAVLRQLVNPTVIPRRRAHHWYSIAASLAVAASLFIAGLFWWQGEQPAPDKGSQMALPDKKAADLGTFAWTIPGQVPSERIHNVCLYTGRNVATLPEKFRRVAMSGDNSGLAGRIRPVTRPMGVAWGILKRTLPASTEKTPNPNQDTGWILSPGRIASVNTFESCASYSRSV